MTILFRYSATLFLLLSQRNRGKKRLPAKAFGFTVLLIKSGGCRTRYTQTVLSENSQLDCFARHCSRRVRWRNDFQLLQPARLKFSIKRCTCNFYRMFDPISHLLVIYLETNPDIFQTSVKWFNFL